MSSFSEYYEKILYPLQDGVLKCVAGSGTEFFLTGGTALNRGFHNKRYSDDRRARAVFVAGNCG